MTRARDRASSSPTISGDLTVSGDLVPSTPLSHRNMIINGDMQVWQRATAATATGAGGYKTVDRWTFSEEAAGEYTSEKHSMSLAELNTTGQATAIKLVCTTADASLTSGQHASFWQGIEAQNLQRLQYGTANAKTLTVSFWVKSNKTGVYCLSLNKIDSTAYYYVKNYTINVADTWEQKKITITPTAGSTSLITSSPAIINNDNGSGFQLRFGLSWGSTFHGTDDTWTASGHFATSSQVNWLDSTSNNFYITGIQLELGSNATPFEHRSFAEELTRCHRYFIRAGSGAFTGATSGLSAVTCQYYSSGNANGGFYFPVYMRTTPTSVYVGGWTVYSNGSGLAATTANNGVWHGGASINFTTSGHTAGHGGNAYASAGSYATYSAEL